MEVRTLNVSDIKRCPFSIIALEHYRPDNSCKCNDADHRKMMIAEWGYKERDFVNIPLLTPAPDADFVKIVHLGKIKGYNDRYMHIYCEIKFCDGKLSICGVEGPRKGGNCAGSCGQIDMHLRQRIREIVPAKGWSYVKLVRFFDVWHNYHLNDMRAASPAQQAWLDTNNPAQKNDYKAVSDVLAAAGLNPDPNYLHNGEPYKYGSAWLKTEVPANVIKFLRDLPDTDKQPAWV